MCQNLKYHIPAPIWTQLYGIQTHDEFMSKFLIQGKFHANVPAEIVKDFLTVEKLIEFSYYHYSFLDEAYSKSLRIFESAVKLRLKNLGYEINRFKSLGKLVKMLKPHASEVFYNWWDVTREVRNEVVHSNSGTLLGIAVLNKIPLMVNAINSIFLEKEYFDLINAEFNRLNEKTELLLGKQMVLIIGKSRILVRDIFLGYIFQKNGVTHSLWTFYPVLESFPKSLQEAHECKPIFLRLKNIDFSGMRIAGNIMDSNEKIIVSITKQPNDLKAFEIHNQLMDDCNQNIKAYYFGILNKKSHQEVSKFMYEECW